MVRLQICIVLAFPVAWSGILEVTIVLPHIHRIHPHIDVL